MSDKNKYRCRQCGHTFERTYGVDVNGLAVFYCNRCGKPYKADLSTGWAPIPDCDCGGTYDAAALGCCPQCGKLLTEADKEPPKEEQYRLLLKQVESLVAGEHDLIAKMANTACLLHQTFGFWWTGFYRVLDDELVLGPFQGPLACMHIGYGRGVCGSSWKEGRTLVVPDVEVFPGHIACSSLSRSEIVVPLREQGAVIGVLDIDSKELNTFDATDQAWLEKICNLITQQP